MPEEAVKRKIHTQTHKFFHSATKSKLKKKEIEGK